MATGNDLLAIGRTRLGQRYVLGARAPMNNANWRGPWDCAEFASWCVFQVSGRLYGCDRRSGDPAMADAFTGYWDRDARELGERITVAQAGRIPGAALLRVPVPNRIGHAAFSDGRGGTVEAQNARAGVIESRASGRPWDYGVLVPWIRYESGARVDISPPPFAFHLTQPMMKGPRIVDIQHALKARGIDPGPIDGAFGPMTDAAVRAFQLEQGLTPDGIVGLETARHLGLG